MSEVGSEWTAAIMVVVFEAEMLKGLNTISKRTDARYLFIHFGGELYHDCDSDGLQPPQEGKGKLSRCPFG